MTDADRDQPSDTMRERADESTWFLWVLLDADRRFVAAIFSAGLFVTLVVVGVLHPTPGQKLLTRGDPIETLYQALITGTITGVTLVLTLSQLVLSQELGAVGDQRDRMAGAMEFRSDVADAVGTAVSPAEPSAFLRSLVRATKEHAQEVEDAVEADDLDQNLSDLLSTYLDSIVGNAETVTEQLEGANFGEFDVVKAALNYNYSWKLYAGRRIREQYGDELSDDALDRLGTLVDTLELFGPAREHFKTLYFQWELSNLSRALLYVAIPALAVAISAQVYFDPRDFANLTFGVADSLWILAITTTVSLLPFTLLLAYILRIVTITKRTLSIGPFMLRETDRSVDVNWD
ncbi:hypothetical protein EGH21_11915 [Halomicroarcula sp. F13]|uniref:Uncharacterized protein n=1 Tax=Haloarcula rubra TaxID=2487747 RepID=A0AAW4PRG8_9EURY|nr:hypothetical protein [Halomicroarcula rubra]MBX0323734.1 hypothetical protein [Halomicroarcula rubra]